MDNKTNESLPPRWVPTTISQKEFKRRFALLTAEVDADFPGTVPDLEKGQAKILWVTDKKLAFDLNPDAIRRLGGLIVLASYYGAAVIYINENETVEVSGKEEDQN